MTWTEQLVLYLADCARRQQTGYRVDTSGRLGTNTSAEVNALAALALLAWQRPEAELLLELLEKSRWKGFRVNTQRTLRQSNWATPLASLAWSAAWEPFPHMRRVLQERLDLDAATMLLDEGKASPRQPQFGHDSTLIGWPWAKGTHSWLEPTALCVMALTARGWGTHARVVTGRRLILNRLLPGGGANYGNTVVLGQTLKPHLRESGLALLALPSTEPPKARATADWIAKSLRPNLPPNTLSWAVMGLAAHGLDTEQTDGWLAAAAPLSPESPLDAALLLLAGLGNRNPLIRLTRGTSTAGFQPSGA